MNNVVTLGFVAVALVGCGGQAVVNEQSSAADASFDAGHAADTGTEADVGQPDVLPDVVDAAEPDNAAPKPWDHKCLCKNWTDTVYPPEFYTGPASCVGVDECPEGTVCCAGPCISPEVCNWEGYRTKELCALAPELNECCDLFTKCVAPDQCAPEGVLIFDTFYDIHVVHPHICWAAR